MTTAAGPLGDRTFIRALSLIVLPSFANLPTRSEGTCRVTRARVRMMFGNGRNVASDNGEKWVTMCKEQNKV